MALIFMLFMALESQPISARERRGSMVVVTMTDGSKVKGELLAVKSNTLLVYDRDAGQGKSFNLQQVVKVKILNKSKLVIGLAIGLGFGLGLTMFDTEGRIHHNISMTPVPISGLIGAVLGALAGLPTTFSQTGELSLSVQQNLDELKSYARERDFKKLAVE
jgi:hypothetical protein